MGVLPDILTTGLKVVFCGTAVGERSAARGHYYAGRGNDFWRLLKDAGLTPRLLSPEKDATLPEYGLGVTDLVKNIAQSHDRGLIYDIEGFRRKVATYKPRWVAFTSKEAGKVAAKAFGQPTPGLGVAPWTVVDARVFVLPSPSGANRRSDYDGRPTRLDWWRQLADLVRERQS